MPGMSDMEIILTDQCNLRLRQYHSLINFCRVNPQSALLSSGMCFLTADQALVGDPHSSDIATSLIVARRAVFSRLTCSMHRCAGPKTVTARGKTGQTGSALVQNGKRSTVPLKPIDQPHRRLASSR
jgi:hypothetical protein